MDPRLHFISGRPRSGSTLLVFLRLVQHETRGSTPAKAMQTLCAFPGEKPPAHDFGHVDYDVTEFDRRAGTPGLFRCFANAAFWCDPKRSPQDPHII